MNTIAVLIPSFTLEYSIDVLSGIYDYFSGKDVKVIVAQTKFPHSTIGVFDYQYFTSVEFLKAQDVDAYIVVSGVFTASIPQQDLEDIVAQFAPRPVISIGADLSLPGTYSILADCNKSFSDIVKHLKEKHGCKKIAFFSANSTKSAEALERYDAFTTALEENDLAFYPDLVMDGLFNYAEAKKVILRRYSTKEDIDFDAVVCANDMMAAGCMEALQQLGVKIPDDVKISGFDDAVVSKISSPKLSTINQAIYNQGLKAAELTDTILNGKSIHKKNLISLLPKFRQSCGCISVYSSEPHFIDTEGKTCVDAEDEDVNLHQFVNELNERNKLITLMDTVRGSNTLKQFFYNLKYIAQQCDMSCIAVNFFKDVC
ncbi:MAG: substrate-binding domain-containing protein, partial [Treponema sp.]|nr:substrate-binding domain-containing protein [Treponema sp.]